MKDRINIISESYKTYQYNNKKKAKKKYIPLILYRKVLESYGDLLLETMAKTGTEIKIAQYIGSLQFVNVKRNVVDNTLTKEFREKGFIKEDECVLLKNEKTGGYWFDIHWNKRAKKGNYRKYVFKIAHRNKFKKTRNSFDLIQFYKEKGWKLFKIK